MDGRRHWLLWDGDCGLCRVAAAWVVCRDATGLFAAAAWQRAPSPPMTPALAQACRQAVHVVTREGSVLAGEVAVLFILGELGWKELSRLGARAPLAWLAAGAYRAVARHRSLLSRLLGYSTGCSVGGCEGNVKTGT